MPGAREDRHRFDLEGGTVALDFVNTVSGMRGAGNPRDRLLGYGDIVYWAEQADLIDGAGAAALYARGGRGPGRAAPAVTAAIRRREGLHEVVLAAIDGRETPPDALDVLN